MSTLYFKDVIYTLYCDTMYEIVCVAIELLYSNMGILIKVQSPFKEVIYHGII